MKTFSEERLEEMESKLNGALGRMIVTAMSGSNPEIKEAHAMLIDFAGDFTDLINEELTMNTPTPERSVEEKFQHALDSIVFNHNPIEYDNQFGKLVESVLTEILQAERQKREERDREVVEMVEQSKSGVDGLNIPPLYKTLSEKVTFKNGFNQALEDIINSLQANDKQHDT